MEKVAKVLSNCQQGLTEEEKAQARANIGAGSAYVAGTNISISGNRISVTGLSSVATSGSYNDLTDKPTFEQVNADWDAVSGAAQILNKPDVTEIEVAGYVEPHPDTVSIGTNGEVEANMSGTTNASLGILPVSPSSSDANKFLMATYNGSSVGTSWQPVTGGQGGYARHDAELYLHHTTDSFKEYHVRNVANNAINHVAVENLQGQICGLLIEAPTIGVNEEYNYTVQFDCVNSSGGCGVDVENAAPKIITVYGVDSSSMYLKVTGASSPSDAINKEIKVVETVTPNSQIIKDGNGNNTSVVYSVGQTNKWLRIDRASYYGVTEYTTLAGPLVVTDVAGTSTNTTDTSVNFSGSPTCQVRVHGNVWEMVRF